MARLRYSYDGNGNWTQLSGSASTYHFVYDAENRLDYYAAPSMSSAYSYNGMGLRVAESDSGTGERDLINDGTSPGSSLLVDHNISAKTVAHVYTPGLEQRDGLNGAMHLFGVDALGSVRALINDDGGQAVTDAQGYYGYGITRSRTGSDAFTFGFAGAAGYQTDPNQLMLLGNREYHPFTGRFLTRDPAHAGDNDYEYANDNPLKYFDPSGLTSYEVTMTYTTTEYVTSDTETTAYTYSWSITFTMEVPDDQHINSNISWADTFNRGSSIPFWLPGGNHGFNIIDDAIYMKEHNGPGTVGDYKNSPKYPKQTPSMNHNLRMGGNFNFGAIGAAMGVPLGVLLVAGDADHMKGTLSLQPHPGDEQEAVIAGYFYTTTGYNSQFLHENPGNTVGPFVTMKPQ